MLLFKVLVMVLPTFPLRPDEKEDLVRIHKGVSLSSICSYYAYRSKEDDKLNIIKELLKIVKI